MICVLFSHYTNYQKKSRSNDGYDWKIKASSNILFYDWDRDSCGNDYTTLTYNDGVNI